LAGRHRPWKNDKGEGTLKLSDHLRQGFTLDPSSWAVEFDGSSYTWAELAAASEAVVRGLSSVGLRDSDVVGWAAQNSLPAVASLAALILTEHCAAIINPHLGPGILAEEIEEQRFPAIVGDPKFWAIPGVAEAAKRAGSAGLVVTWSGTAVNVQAQPGLERVGSGPHRPPMPDAVVERISSGTTGPPKRTPHLLDSMMTQLAQGQRKEGVKAVDAQREVKRSPAIITRPLAHAGCSATLLALYSARPIVLLEKFTVDGVVDAIRRHRVKAISLVPTMTRMIWDAQVPPEHLSSLTAIRSGTAPLDPDFQAVFEEKYGVPILIDYGATEFGGVAAWTLADHKRYAKEKRGSVGRALPGVEMRIIDPDTREEISDGRMGLLDLRIPHKSADWILTNDIASIDADGFLFIHGRADDAIVRGGFKVLPEEVIKVLRQHPDVQDVAVVGVPDERLGQVPVAVIEIKPGRTPSEAAMKAFARDRMTPYQVPVAFKFVDALPRTPSMKVIRAAVLELAKS
jgi:acyl-CoA synthetase (AMP-forming)/AMP-acid ligase II